MNSPASCPRTMVPVLGILKNLVFSPEREEVGAHREAVRADGQGVHVS